MRCVIGMDGGGTKTLLKMTDLHGNILCEVAGGLSNICASTKETVENNLTDLMKRCFEQAPKDIEIVSVCIGSAGVVARENIEFFKTFLQNVTECENVLVENDAYVALFANLMDKPGISITSGTGSICCGKNVKGDFYRVGGWGHLFSDEGSAYDIAVSSLREALRSFDGRRKPTLLLDKLNEETHTNSAEELVSHIYLKCSDKSDIARLSKVADFAAAEGDNTAYEVLKKAAYNLYLMCQSVAEKLELNDDNFTVVLNGGVLKNSSIVKETFTKYITERYESCKVMTAEKDASWGAVYLALSGYKDQSAFKE